MSKIIALAKIRAILKLIQGEIELMEETYDCNDLTPIEKRLSAYVEELTNLLEEL